MIRFNRKALTRIVLGLFILAISLTVKNASLLAQDLDDSLESEIDALNTVQPTKGGEGDLTDELADEEPLADPFESEKSDIKPLEKSKAPPAKAIAKPAAKPVPVRTEPKVTEPESKSSNELLAPISDEPNPAFEARLAAIYSTTSDPVSDEKWSGMLGGRAAESYSVQAGDTLWDLSQTLFADGFYWSKLWAENPEIQNPHQIEKGQAIRFIGGTEAAPPEIRVVKDVPDELTIQTQAAFEKEDVVPALQEAKVDEIGSIEIRQSTKFAGTTPNRTLNQAPYYQEDIEGKITQADLEAGVVIEQSEIVPRPVLPPPSEQRRKVMLNIPRSFKEFKYRHFERKVTIQRRSNEAERVPSAIVPSFMAFEKIPEPMGEVAEVSDYEAASLGQVIIVEGNEPLVVGSRMYTVTPRFKLAGHRVVEIGGVLKIGQPLNEGKNLYRATVVYGVNAIRKDSLVLAGEPPRVPFTTSGRRLTAPMTIIGGSYSDTRHYFGDGSTVFLEVEGSGVQVGDVLAVQARRGERGKRVAPDASDPIGILKVFAVNGLVASAFVVISTDDIRPGDKTGSAFPTRLPDLRNEPPRVTRLE